jgi:4-alpha-glucanotransferase
VNPGLFKLDANLSPEVVAGVPPDYFSATGQLWGHPVYRWDMLQKGGYDWWAGRIGRQLCRLDRLRIDHFRGFVAYWEVPAKEKTAVNGRWVEAPADDFFGLLRRKFRGLPIIAEDLGTITPDVTEIMDRFGFPGMRVLLFAFGDDLPTNPYAPHNLIRNCVVYTGTHDNNTTRGWFEKEATRGMRNRFHRYLGRRVSAEEAPLEMIRLAMMSVAETAVFPLQDILGLGENARMNRPSSSNGNWEWRYLPGRLTPLIRNRLRSATELYGRI